MSTIMNKQELRKELVMELIRGGYLVEYIIQTVEPLANCITGQVIPTDHVAEMEKLLMDRGVEIVGFFELDEQKHRYTTSNLDSEEIKAAADMISRRCSAQPKAFVEWVSFEDYECLGIDYQ